MIKKLCFFLTKEKKNIEIDRPLKVNQEGIDSLYKFLAGIKQCKSFFDIGLKFAETFILNRIEHLLLETIQFNQLLKENENIYINLVEIQQRTLEELYQQISFNLKECLQDYKTSIYIHYLLQQLYEIIETNKNCRKIQYQKVLEFKIKNCSFCQRFTFNNNATILFVGYQEIEIKVYGFNSKKKLIKTLPWNSQNVCFCLLWLKKFNQLIVGSNDAIILLNEQWSSNQKLLGHSKLVRRVIINQQEDLIITGSEDKTIKFWKNQNQSWSCQQTINVSFDVTSLSLNFSQNILISCGNPSNIRVIEHLPNQQWIIAQIILIDQYGSHLHFIDDNQFIFLQNQIGRLKIYNYEKYKKQFIIVKQIQLQSCNDPTRDIFFVEFIQHKNILIVKHDRSVNVIKLAKNGDFILEQIIEFDRFGLSGGITNDGKYLIICDRTSTKIQIRQLKNCY